MQGRWERKRSPDGPLGTNTEIIEHKEMRIKGRSKTSDSSVNSTRLHNATSQKTVIFILTAART
jgi:hypothetical protein